MFEDNRKICIDLLIEDGQTSYVVLEFEDDIEDAIEDNDYLQNRLGRKCTQVVHESVW